MDLARRRQLLCLAAASGVVPNLSAALQAAGCAPVYDVFLAAAAAGQLAACRWFLQQGCPIPHDDGQAYMAACCNGDMATAVLRRRLGVPWGPPGEAVYDAVERSPLPMLRWLLEAGCPAGPSVDLASGRAIGRCEGWELLSRHLEEQRQLQSRARDAGRRCAIC
ncbi:hypothetical protein GPECTOR_49g519 [Gonium pectorale]|uniref:Uncharacterized protein n=1 Tax=Gonium pectorale TaxID=33097 RepID=A0A150G8P9_GONPE|nr:hypothetical protein GPECTOR_49g519 [Gonium pectorale]|eukprot:KXZ45935.1 hypothetical protein GPECTOR_49g519 [Gonium pectorale]